LTDDGWTRRRFLAVAGAGAAAVAGAGAVTLSNARAKATRDIIPFHGLHQAGIATPTQERLHFAAFDVTTERRGELKALLQEWTEAAIKMTRGEEVGEYGATAGPYLAPPEDTGEALDLSASNLTLTIGFGPSLFVDADGNDRFGLADQQPSVLRTLPHFPGDNLSPQRSGGDLCVQACADDPVVAVHAVRNLARLAFGFASIRWSQLGFGRSASTSQSQITPRNLMGFKDGTANLKLEDADLLDEFVWVADGDDAASGWLTEGTYLVARRINMRIETWDRTSLQEQEAIIGRDKGRGAPLSGGDEFAPMNFTKEGNSGPLVAMDSHVRHAHPDQNNGGRIFRRGYNFTDGSNGLGHLEAGLFFIAFTRNPDQYFIPLQMNLSRNDALNEYIQHTGSALFAIPAGIAEGEYIGHQLL
jgi:deferrochelatase/peroxidase EfeB